MISTAVSVDKHADDDRDVVCWWCWWETDRAGYRGTYMYDGCYTAGNALI